MINKNIFPNYPVTLAKGQDLRIAFNIHEAINARADGYRSTLVYRTKYTGPVDLYINKFKAWDADAAEFELSLIVPPEEIMRITKALHSVLCIGMEHDPEHFILVEAAVYYCRSYYKLNTFDYSVINRYIYNVTTLDWQSSTYSHYILR